MKTTPKKRRPLYGVWQSMLNRCSNSKHKQWKHYGGRGIFVEDCWKDFECFVSDMGPRPSGCSIERKDNSKGYGPANCIWATRTEQNNNKRNNHILEYNGERHTLTQWSRLKGISIYALKTRMVHNWDVKRALETPTKEPQLLTYNNETKTVADWAKSLGVKRLSLSGRLVKMWSAEKALTTPFRKRPPTCKNSLQVA